MPKIEEQFITVSEDDDGQRFDRWLKKRVPDMPYGLTQKLIRKGAFKIDGKRAKADVKLSEGQEVRIPAYVVEAKGKSAPKDKKPQISDRDVAFVRSLIIYDEGGVIAINKPGDLAVQGGTNQTRYLDAMLPALADEKGVVPRLVHRLDKDTSGVLLLARSAKVAKALGKMFKDRSMRKIYWALTRTVPDPREGTVKASLIKAGGANQERMIVDPENGKYSETEYCVLDHAHTQAAFVAFWPRTGRTHQIRVHAELLETPIIGDHKYSGRHLEKFIEAEPLDIDGLAQGLHLHARRVIFTHPMTHKRVDIMAPLPPAMAKSWKALGFSSKDKTDPFADLD